MPAYQFYRLSNGLAQPSAEDVVLFNDAATLNYAMRAEFPDGCDVWQATRFVGRFHRPVTTEADAAPGTGDDDRNRPAACKPYAP